MEYLNLTKEIRKQLNFANQEFSKEIKKDKNIYNNYKNIGRLYQVVVKHLEYNWHLPLEFEFYKVAARFGFLQCEINSFQLYPIRVSTIQKNDDQLIKCEKQIQKLLSLTYELETKLNFDNNPDLYKEYYDFKKKITVYNKSWGKCELDLITAYYLNYAVFLLSSAPGSTETLVQEQVQQPPSIEDSIPFFTKPKIKTQAIQSVSIKNKFSLTKKTLSDHPLATGSSKIKADILTQANRQSISVKLKLNAKRSHRQGAKDIFSQPKKNRLGVADKENISPIKQSL